MPNSNDKFGGMSFKFCPKCGWPVEKYYTGKTLCSSVKCDYEGPGVEKKPEEKKE